MNGEEEISENVLSAESNEIKRFFVCRNENDKILTLSRSARTLVRGIREADSGERETSEILR